MTVALLLAGKLSRTEKERNSIHKPTTATYTIFVSAGIRYFQIDTYGSDDRVMPEKISQSIQFDEETAKVIVDLLKKEFHFD